MRLASDVEQILLNNSWEGGGGQVIWMGDSHLFSDEAAGECKLQEGSCLLASAASLLSLLLITVFICLSSPLRRLLSHDCLLMRSQLGLHIARVRHVCPCRLSARPVATCQWLFLLRGG